MKFGVAILAAGSGTRFGGDKVCADLGGKPVWKWSYDTFCRMSPCSPGTISEIIVVAGDNCGLISQYPDIKVIRGGSTRVESSYLATVSFSDDIIAVLIHDGARPFVDENLIERVMAGCAQNGACAPVIRVSDTVRQLGPDASQTLDRDSLNCMQTPQGARRDWLLEGYSHATGNEPDDMSLVELSGNICSWCEGSTSNFKITYQEDLERARQIATSKSVSISEIRTGMGYDVHAFSKDPARPMWLGGVHFQNETGLEGHSDADALLHAIVDALLGAVSRGDIGHHFPPSDPQWKDCPSVKFLSHAYDLVIAEGWRISNLDCTVISERPKIHPYEKQIRMLVAGNLKIDPQKIGLKATTNEGLGSIGRGEGLAALAIVTLIK